MKKFCRVNSTLHKFLRTLFQGLVGLVIMNLDILFPGITFPTEAKAVGTVLIMGALSPIMSAYGQSGELDKLYFEGREDEEDGNV